MADSTLKVTTDEIREKASQIDAQIGTMEGIMGDLQTKIDQMEPYFRSKAGEAYRQQYTNVSKNIKGALELSRNRTKSLREAAEAYDLEIGRTEQIAGSLSADGIFL